MSSVIQYVLISLWKLKRLNCRSSQTARVRMRELKLKSECVDKFQVLVNLLRWFAL